jgi:hypothetical protein
VAAGHAVPVVEVVSPQSQGQQEADVGQAGERGKAADEKDNGQGAEAGEEDERHVMLKYVVKGMNEQLITELLEGFHEKP